MIEDGKWGGNLDWISIQFGCLASPLTEQGKSANIWVIGINFD